LSAAAQTPSAAAQTPIEFDFGDRSQVNWATAVAWVVFHGLAVVALFHFEWRWVIAAAVLHWVAIGLGVSLGFHRLLTHRSFKAPKWLEYFLSFCGTLSLEGGPIFWVATHRIHHQRSDQPGDPHSPRDGAWWSHILWTALGRSLNAETRMMSKYAPDLGKDPVHRFLNTYHWLPLAIMGVSLWYFFGAAAMLWCVFFRVTFGLHATWAVNSATHMWGTRRFHTTDDSTNLWWVALLTFGEGWHNNHHAHPTSARHGLEWYQLDVSWLIIRALSAVGLVWDIKLPAAKQLEFMEMTQEERRAA